MLLIPSERVVFPGRRVDVMLDDGDATSAAATVPVGGRVFVSLLWFSRAFRPGTPPARPAQPIDYSVHEVGTISAVVEASQQILVVDGLERGRITSTIRAGGGRQVEVDLIPGDAPGPVEMGDRMRKVRELFGTWAKRKNRLDAMAVYARGRMEPESLLSAMAFFGPFAEPDRQAILEEVDLGRQFDRVEKSLLKAMEN